MKIKVTKTQNTNYWYTRHIGQEFEVQYITKEHTGKMMYWVRSGDAYNTINFVMENDATITEGETQ